jgi:RNA polymerase sporulation-specific sigma factor
MDGDQESFNRLLSRYSPLIQHYVGKYFAAGLTKSDMYQEGCIGLYNALIKFQADKGKFSTFAQLHIKNSMINALKAATRKKQHVLNHSVLLLDFLETSDPNESIMDLAVNELSPEEIYLRKEETEEKRRKFTRLVARMTRIEKLALAELMKGNSYKEAAKHMGVSTKAIDNAIGRIKKKALEKKTRKAG